MRLLTKFLALILLTHLALVLFTNRALFFSKFDEVYWKDKYEHSQWKLPLSVRTLGDDGLYLYEGYRLIKGGDPTLLNAEVPPLGKYLIGLSIIIFGNGHLYGFFTTLLALVSFFLLSKALLRDTRLALVATTLVALDPLITSQFTLTMLDSLQLLFLLLTLYLLTRIQKKKLLFLMTGLAGVAFGLFAETKFPVLGLPIVLILGLTLWLQTKKLAPLFIFLGSATVSYLLPYGYYFFLGHTFSDWLGVQKWIATFYANANVNSNIGSALTLLLSGRYQNLFTKQWVAAPEWSPTWTIITLLAAISSVAILWRIIRRREGIDWLPVAGITIFALLFFSAIPFWTRYVVLLLPLLYLTAIKVIASAKKPLRMLIFGVLLATNVFATTMILFQTPE